MCLALLSLTIITLLVVGTSTGPAIAQTEAGENTSIIDLENEEVNIELQAQQRTVEHDEPVILVLSAASYITNSDPITVQLIIESSSGVSITTSTAEQGSGNQFSTVTTINPGYSESLQVIVSPSEPGTYEITSEIVYFVGENRNASDGERERVSITQNPPPRDLISYVPDIISFVISGYLTIYVIGSSNAQAIKDWGWHHERTSKTIIIIIFSSSCIGFASWLFSRSWETGVNILVFAIIIGIMLTIIASVAEFVYSVRLLYVYLGLICILAVPIRIAFDIIIAIF